MGDGAVKNLSVLGNLRPGNSPAILTTGSLSFNSAADFFVELNGATAGSGYDQVKVSGTVTLDSATLHTGVGFQPVNNSTFTIIDNDGSDPVTNTFNGLPEAGTLNIDGRPFRISYTGGTGNDVTLTALPLTPLEQWRLLHFGTIDNSGNAADDFDFDKDGLSNLLEFAFGLDPKQSSAGQLPPGTIIGSNYVTSFTQPAGVSSITYGAEWSTTLSSNPADWTGIPDSDPSLTGFSFSVPIGSKTRLFMKLTVTNP